MTTVDIPEEEPDWIYNDDEEDFSWIEWDEIDNYGDTGEP